MNARSWSGWLIIERESSGEIVIRIRRDERRGHLFHGFSGDDCRSTRGLELRRVFHVGEKCDLASGGFFDRGDAMDLDIGIANELTIEQSREFAGGERGSH